MPDFGQTAHSVQGASLAAVIVDCLKVDLCTKTTEMLAAYIGLSRVRRKEALLIAEPFSPALFCHGQPPGPEILMKVLRRDITADDCQEGHSLFSKQDIPYVPTRTVRVFHARHSLCSKQDISCVPR